MFLALCYTTTPAQEPPSNVHQQTTTPANARYEIVQSELAAKLTFRLDRFTGQVRQLVHTKDDSNTWQMTTVIGGLPGITSAPRARFQIFTSGLAARHTFLIDTDTGKTWTLLTLKGKNPDGTEYEEVVWGPFVEE